LQPKSQKRISLTDNPKAGGDFDSRYSQRGVNGQSNKPVKQLDYHEVCVHTLGTLLLRIYSKTDSILSRLKNLLGHENIETTMDYLHIAQLDTIKAFSPLDTLFAKCGTK
jgi:integrase